MTSFWQSSSSYTIDIYEMPRLDPRLGRLVAHDSRSLRYALPESMPMTALRTVKHSRFVPIFDQGNVGACTAFAGLGCLGTGAFYNEATMNAVSKANYKFNNGAAMELYRQVTKIDEFKGSYPPDDTGSSGNAVGKLFKQLGFIKGWKHGFSLEAAMQELQSRPVITGVPWYAGMDRPDANGFVNPTGQLKGGHEFVVSGINMEREYVDCDNSWSDRFGVKGSFKMTFDVWQDLLSQRGDITAFEPLDVVAPTPTPTPTPPVENELQLAERALTEATVRWLKAKGYKVG